MKRVLKSDWLFRTSSRHEMIESKWKSGLSTNKAPTKVSEGRAMQVGQVVTSAFVYSARASGCTISLACLLEVKRSTRRQRNTIWSVHRSLDMLSVLLQEVPMMKRDL